MASTRFTRWQGLAGDDVLAVADDGLQGAVDIGEGEGEVAVERGLGIRA